MTDREGREKVFRIVEMTDREEREKVFRIAEITGREGGEKVFDAEIRFLIPHRKERESGKISFFI